MINSNTEFKSIRTNLKLWIEQVAVKQWGRNRWGREAYMAEREGVGRHGGEVCGPRRRRVRLLRQEAPDLSGGRGEGGGNSDHPGGGDSGHPGGGDKTQVANGSEATEEWESRSDDHSEEGHGELTFPRPELQKAARTPDRPKPAGVRPNYRPKGTIGLRSTVKQNLFVIKV